MKSLRLAWEWFLDALFPPKCLICQKEGGYLCQEHCRFDPAPPNEATFQFVSEIFSIAAYYDPNVQKTVEFFKFKGFRSIADIFAQEIVRKLPKGFFQNTVFVPIPLHWTRKMWRGFDQAELLTRALARQLPEIQICTDLRRVRRTKQQVKLKREQRLKNLQDAFVWKGKYGEGSQVVLVDDVVASGATLDAAAEAMKKTGFEKIYALAFARGGGNKRREKN